jgi:hypothetical protein
MGRYLCAPKRLYEVEIGFNDDVVYRGSTFHIQTEDHGMEDGRVSSQLFISGRILESTIVEYAPVLDGITDEEERKAKIRKVMVASHRKLYKKLFSGDLDEMAGIDAEAPPAELDTAEEFTPTQSRMPEPAARVMEQDGKVTFTFDDGQEMNLAALAEQLNSVNVMPHGGVVDAAKGGEMFDDLGVDLNATPEPQGPAPPHVTVATRDTAEMAEPPTFAMPGPTGRNAFQGLLEPPAGADIIGLVTEFLASR